MKMVTSVEAQNRFGELLDNAQREPISITRHGRPIAYILSSDTYQTLTNEVRENSDRVKAYLAAVAEFRGQGTGGSTQRLLKERRQDEKAE